MSLLLTKKSIGFIYINTSVISKALVYDNVLFIGIVMELKNTAINNTEHHEINPLFVLCYRDHLYFDRTLYYKITITVLIRGYHSNYLPIISNL